MRGGVIKFAIGMFTYVAHFDRKVGIYRAKKWFQFASRKELYAILIGLDGTAFSGPARAIAYGPHTGIFFNIFAVKARAGPYGSYDKPCTVLKVFG